MDNIEESRARFWYLEISNILVPRKADLCQERADSTPCKALHSPGHLDPNAVLCVMSASNPSAEAPDLSRLGATDAGFHYG